MTSDAGRRQFSDSGPQTCDFCGLLERFPDIRQCIDAIPVVYTVHTQSLFKWKGVTKWHTFEIVIVIIEQTVCE